jgi:hypothetical protein
MSPEMVSFILKLVYNFTRKLSEFLRKKILNKEFFLKVQELLKDMIAKKSELNIINASEKQQLDSQRQKTILWMRITTRFLGLRISKQQQN